MRIPYSLIRFGLTALLGGLGLLGFADALRHQVERGARSEGRVARRMTVKSELRTVFAPRALFDFAKAHPTIDRPDQLASLLKAHGLGRTWYVIVASDVLSNGERHRNVCYVYPSTMPYRFPSTRLVLEMLREGDLPGGKRGDEGTRIEIIPEAIARLDPAVVVSDLAEMAR
jgi:hypothetical protein